MQERRGGVGTMQHGTSLFIWANVVWHAWPQCVLYSLSDCLDYASLSIYTHYTSWDQILDYSYVTHHRSVLIYLRRYFRFWHLIASDWTNDFSISGNIEDSQGTKLWDTYSSLCVFKEEGSAKHLRAGPESFRRVWKIVCHWKISFCPQNYNRHREPLTANIKIIITLMDS